MKRKKPKKSVGIRRCKPCEGGLRPKTVVEIAAALRSLPGWHYEDGKIVRTFHFENYDETVSFVNAVAWIARRQNHHPVIGFDYRNCAVRYSTHAIRGISDNDFLCAARINLLMSS